MFLFRTISARDFGASEGGRDGRRRLEGQVEMERRRIEIFCIYLGRGMPFRGIRLVYYYRDGGGVDWLACIFFWEEASWGTQELTGEGYRPWCRGRRSEWLLLP